MTAPEDVIRERIVPYTEAEFGCTVVGISSNLSNRPRLREDLARHLDDAEAMVVEVKAAAIDVATKEAMEEGLEVVYMDNEPVVVGGDVEDLSAAVVSLARTAATRHGGE